MGTKVLAKKVVQYEFGVDPAKQVALLQTRFVDGSTEILQISKKQLPEVIESLKRLLAQLETGALPPKH